MSDPVFLITGASSGIGAALTIRATMTALQEARGHLLLTGSVAGRRALPGSLYSCTKWAVSQPAHVDINEVLVRPTRQST